MPSWKQVRFIIDGPGGRDGGLGGLSGLGLEGFLGVVVDAHVLFDVLWMEE